jgi:hypothetical protein
MMSYVPATLWAGALTPSVTQKMMFGRPIVGMVYVTLLDHLFRNTNAIAVPGSGPGGNFSHLYENVNCWTAQQSNDTFTTCLKQSRTANLLRSVATASSLNGLPVVHNKWDNTNLQYIGRSFGVGSSAGLVDHDIVALGNIQSYTYHEIGFETDTKCIYNKSSVSQFDLLQKSSEGMAPNMYVAKAILPNSNWTGIGSIESNTPQGYDFYVQSSFENTNGIVSTFSKKPLGNDNRWMFAILAGSDYSVLDKLQCETTFRPTNFTITVSVTNGTITVSPLPSSQVSDPDLDNKLRMRALLSYGLLFVTTSLYTSAVGDAFNENIRNLKVQRAVPSDVQDPKYLDLVRDAVGDSVRAVMEDSLVALGSAALTRSNATVTAFATATRSAVQIGSKPFIWAVFIVNVVGLIVVSVGFCLLLRADVPIFEYSDLGSMAFGVLQGVVVLTQDSGAKVVGEEAPWTDDARDERIGNITARLRFATADEK